MKNNKTAIDTVNDTENITADKELENKQQNKKALKIFIPVILAAAALGFVLGIGIIILQTQGDVGISGAMNFFHSLALFGAPWAVIIVTAAGLLATGLHISSARKVYKSADESAVDGEMDEGAIKRIEAKLSDGLAVQSLTQILQFMFFGIFIVNLNDYVWLGSLPVAIIAILAFMAGIFAGIRQQQVIVDIEKLLNPSKDGSVYDVNFKKKWEASCDELEKSQIYQAAYKAYKAGTFTCIVLWLIFASLGPLLQAGILPVVAVSVIWLVMTAAYLMEARKLEGRNDV